MKIALIERSIFGRNPSNSVSFTHDTTDFGTVPAAGDMIDLEEEAFLVEERQFFPGQGVVLLGRRRKKQT